MLLVLHVLQQHQRQRHGADARQADQRHGAGYGAIVPAPALRNCAVLTRRSSLLVSATSRTISSVTLARFASSDRRHALDAHDRVRQRRKVALVAHAAQQEFERAARLAAARRRSGGRIEPLRAARRGRRRRRFGRCAASRATARIDQCAQRVVEARVLAPSVRGQDHVFVRMRSSARYGSRSCSSGRPQSISAEHHAGGEHVHRGCGAAPRARLGRRCSRACRRCARRCAVAHARGDAEVHHARPALARPSGCSTASGRGARCPARARRRARRARRSISSAASRARQRAARGAARPASGRRRTRTP